MTRKALPNTEDLRLGILKGDRVLLSRAITLIESQLPEHRAAADRLLESLINRPEKKSIRIGITGTPGVGKSTFIEVFGSELTRLGRKVAVLPVDPSSIKSKGSILGDKTRMDKLSNDPNAYIRPSPTGKTLGGVTRKTRETILLCEAAGFDAIIVETVGVGQSETTVRQMVDFFLLLLLPGSGDELQGIKRGIMEMADAIAVNKADGDNLQKSQLAARQYQHALHLMPPAESRWEVPVLTCSAMEEKGISDIWGKIVDYQNLTEENGFFHKNRARQTLQWFDQNINQLLEDHFISRIKEQLNLEQLKDDVAQGKTSINHALAAVRLALTNLESDHSRGT